MAQNQAVAACHTQWRGGKPKAANESLMLEYFVPIESRAELDGEFMINGTAITETTTTNGHKFLGEELKSSASTLIGVPLLKDHENSVDAIVGKVSKAHFDENLHSIPFKAVVKDPAMIKKIKDGLLNTVSVGAHVDPKNIEETEDGEIIPHGIIFKELSLVAVPADAGATFDIALNNAWKGLKSHSQDENSHSDERRYIQMTEEEKKSEELEAPVEKPKEEKEEPKEEEKEEVKTESAFERGFKAGRESVKESDIDENREDPKEDEKPKEPEKPKEEEKKEEEAEEEDSEDEEEVEEKANYKIVQGHKSFSAERKSYVYN